MIKKVQLIILVVTIISLSFTGGCAKKTEGSSVKEGVVNKVQPTASKAVDEKDVELKVWCWYSLGDMLKKFESENKGIKIKEELFDFNKCEEEYLKALASGEGPDVLLFDSGFFNQFTTGNVLQDLLQEPFSAGKYQRDFLGWESGMSVDKKHLLSLTVSTAPYVTLYRADIMKENGFPSEPEEFGKLIENPDNLLKVAKKLKEKNKYIFQYATDLTDIVGATLGFFDDNLNYIRDGDLFKQSLNISIEAGKNGFQSGKNFWGEDGKKAIVEDKLVMIPVASYAMSILENYVPEQKGKWRVTKPPFGLAAWASDARISINIQSKHKDEAWKLVEYIATQKYDNGSFYTNSVSGYIPVHKNPEAMKKKAPFFGDQNVYPLLEELAVNMIQYKLTPLDKKALEIYRSSVWSAVNREANPDDAIAQIKKDTENAVAEDKKALKGN